MTSNLDKRISTRRGAFHTKRAFTFIKANLDTTYRATKAIGHQVNLVLQVLGERTYRILSKI